MTGSKMGIVTSSVSYVTYLTPGDTFDRGDKTGQLKKIRVPPRYAAAGQQRVKSGGWPDRSGSLDATSGVTLEKTTPVIWEYTLMFNQGKRDF